MSPRTEFKPQLAVLLIALIGAGCATVGPDFEGPTPPTAAGYLTPGEPIPEVARIMAGAASVSPWWTALGSADLDATIRRALANSPTLAEADATLAQAQSALAATQGLAAPQADASAGASAVRTNLQAYGLTEVERRNPRFELYRVGADITYDFDLFGGRRRRIESAQAAAEASARRRDAAYLALTANVAIQAVTIASLNAQLGHLQQMVDADREALALVERARALGGATDAAIATARLLLAEDLALLPPLRRDLGAARHALALLVGESPSAADLPDFPLAGMRLTRPVPVALPAEVVARRPDIAAALADLHAATAGIGVATADLYPNITLTAAYAQGAVSPGDLFSYDTSGWSVGPGLTAPLFNGGTLRARRRQARDAAIAASARYRQTVLAAFAQVADSLSALSADEALIAALGQATEAADQKLTLARSAHRLGGGTQLEVIDARRALGEARAEQARAEGQQLIDAVRLFAATGADWRTSTP